MAITCIFESNNIIFVAQTKKQYNMKTKKFTIFLSVTTKGDYTNTFMYFDTHLDLLRYYRMLLMVGYCYDFKSGILRKKTSIADCRVYPYCS